MTMSRWFRHYAGMMRDDKLVRVAVKSRQPVERVVWLYGAMLESACELQDGGRFDIDADEVSYFLRCEADDIAAIIEALEVAGRTEGDRIPRWADRQFESDASRERVRKHREKKAKQRCNGDETLQPVTVTLQETETDTDTEEERTHVAKAPRVSAPISEAVDLWNETASRAGFPVAQIVSERRRTAIKARLAECGGLDGWKIALAKAEASSFCRGAGNSGWVLDLDALTQAKTFTKLMEGSYDNRSQSRPASVHDQFKRAFERVDSYIEAMD